MGYTHYWKNNARFTDEQWSELQERAADLFAAAEDAGIELCYEFDNPKGAPVIDQSVIRFNAPGEEGHETFLLSRAAHNFDFCKTARKPYDAVVVAMLMEAARVNPEFEWSSDGAGEEHAFDAAQELCDAIDATENEVA